MSEHQPPAGTPEYLEYGSGAPIPPESVAPTEPPRGRRMRRAWWIGGGVVALLGVGAGAWAALSFFERGAQPAEALPADTVAYLSIDLDPSGGQKIDAFRTLNKFPAFKDEVGINSVDELRHKLGDQLVGQVDCPGLDYDQDIDPWLGDRMAVAGVPLDGDPQLVVVVQVKDEDAARDGIAKLNACDDSDDDAGLSVHDGWAVLAESQKVVDEVVAATDNGTLADDATYQKWTEAVGEAGVVNAYASPEAGRYLAQELGDLSRMFSPAPFGEELSGEMSVEPAEPGAMPSVSSSAHRVVTADGDDPFTETLSQFKGGAATLRFTGDGLELAMAGDGSSPELSQFTGTTGGELVSRLPDDTAAAIGASLPKGWLSRYADSMTPYFGAGTSRDELFRELSQETGLDVPDDVETLLGSGVALAISRDFDFEAAENSDDGSGLPIGLTVKGDPEAIEAVLDKIRAQAGDLAFLGSDSSGDLEAIGPSQDYRHDLLAGGHLGDDETFRSVVPDAAKASSLFFVNIDALEPSITKAAAGDQETIDNVTPLRAFGLSSWTDDAVTRFSLKVSTN
jgi:hypothetical protein